MNIADKSNILRKLLSENIDSDIATKYILQAKETILNKMYPFGMSDDVEVPKRYEHIQVQIAAELYSKRGAEGQTSHSENGINRLWENGSVSPSLLKLIMPHCGGVERS